jgi:gliding motility-associated-like protein
MPTPIFLPPGSRALAVGTNPSVVGPNPTYFTTVLAGGIKRLHYWNGTIWVNTGAPMNMDDITGSCGTIFGVDSGSGYVFKWAGGAATTAPFLVDASPFFGTSSYDIAGDCTGGFWIINQTSTTPRMRKFSSTGVLQQTYTLSGTFAAGGSGLAINGNTVYYDGSDGNLYTGIINTATLDVNFSRTTNSIPFKGFPITDFASCGFEGACLGKGALDSVGVCSDTANIVLNATGPGPYNWNLVSGPATISGNASSPSVLVRAWGPAVVTYKDADCAGVNTIPDTTVIFVTKATVNAGPDQTIIGCRGSFPDTLYGTVTDTTTGVIYARLWGPLDGSVISGETTDTVIINPATDKVFWLAVQTLNGCTFVDSVHIKVADSTPKAQFTFIPQLGCEDDTVRFINTSPTYPAFNYIIWDFDDTVNNNGNRITSNAVSPTHIYKEPGIYSVLLTISNPHCTDSMRQDVDILHPLIAKFTVDDSACSHELLSFVDGSTTSGPNTFFFYKFGDGDTSLLASPTHTYHNAGSYTAMLAIKDYLGCVDTTYRTIFIDTIPFVRFVGPDTVICEGQAIHLYADYLRIGNKGITVDLGDGTVFQNSDTTIYSFATTGPKNIILTAHYRVCKDTIANLLVNVNEFPGVNIGLDTVLCPNGSPIVLSDRVNVGNRDVKYLWNTGDSSASITARDIGNYWLRVTAPGGCTGTDSILIRKDCYVNIPNSFTPDGDGVNDYFLPRQFLSRSLNAFKMTIFNRWGEIIYESSTVNGSGWDGKFNDKPQPLGVYVYVIDATFDNGVKEHYTGNVTLLR